MFEDESIHCTAESWNRTERYIYSLLAAWICAHKSVCVCLLFVLQVRKWEQRWYSANLAAAASGLEEHSAGHADQITRVCVCARLSKVWRAAALTAQSRGLGWSCGLKCHSKFYRNQSSCVQKCQTCSVQRFPLENNALFWNKYILLERAKRGFTALRASSKTLLSQLFRPAFICFLSMVTYCVIYSTWIIKLEGKKTSSHLWHESVTQWLIARLLPDRI